MSNYFCLMLCLWYTHVPQKHWVPWPEYLANRHRARLQPAYDEAQAANRTVCRGSREPVQGQGGRSAGAEELLWLVRM